MRKATKCPLCPQRRGCRCSSAGSRSVASSRPRSELSAMPRRRVLTLLLSRRRARTPWPGHPRLPPPRSPTGRSASSSPRPQDRHSRSCRCRLSPDMLSSLRHSRCRCRLSKGIFSSSTDAACVMRAMMRWRVTTHRHCATRTPVSSGGVVGSHPHTHALSSGVENVESTVRTDLCGDTGIYLSTFFEAAPAPGK